jgi:ATP-dependent protease ClpP protease subunit
MLAALISTSAEKMLIPFALASTNPQTLRLEGPITAQTAQDFDALLARSAHIEEIILNSSGGDEIAAIHIGEIVKKNRINTTVSGRCLSACFQYIFLASNRKLIKENSIVAFHSNSKSANNWILSSNIDLKKNNYIKKYFDISSKISNKIDSLITNKNTINFMDRAFWALGPICIAYRQKGNTFKTGIVFESSAVVPSRSVLEKMDVIVEGQWPINNYDVINQHSDKFENPNFVEIFNGEIQKNRKIRQC